MPLTASQRSSLPADGSICTLDRDEWAAGYEIVGRSFSGTSETLPEPGNHWILGPELQDLDDPVRREACEFMMTTYLSARHNPAWEGCGMLAIRGPDGELSAVCVCHRMETGEVGGCCGLLEGFQFAWAAIATASRKGLPSVFKPKTPDGGERARRIGDSLHMRGDKLGDAIKLMQGTQGPHWYAAAVAVHPERQGQGLVKKLLTALSAIADAEHLPCYLDCSSERHCRIYERCGYGVVVEEAIAATVESETSGAWPERLTAYGMLRSVPTVP
jgi:ribosomal protein S18 acetylase RimI-like enzyme